MNVVKEISRINERQLTLGENSSWHDQYKHSAYIYVGGLDYELTEGDVITIFSQFGEVADVNIPKDQKTQKSKGFAFLMYEDQRSTILAVDNLNGSKLLERILRVDHVDKYKQLEHDSESGKMKEREEQSLNARPENFIGNGDEASSSSGSEEEGGDGDPDLQDPMAQYLREQKKLAKAESKGKGKSQSKKSSKREGETKEERRARKLAKRVAKEAKKYGMLGEPSKSRRGRDEAREESLRDRSRSRSPDRRRPNEDEYERHGDYADRKQLSRDRSPRRSEPSQRRRRSRSRSPYGRKPAEDAYSREGFRKRRYEDEDEDEDEGRELPRRRNDRHRN